MKKYLLLLPFVPMLLVGCFKIVEQYSNPFAVVFPKGADQPVQDRSYDKLDYVFVFTPKSRYILPTEDQADWNKLFGPRYWGDYSARWVLSYDPANDKFLVGWYVHDGTGQPKYQKVTEVSINEPIRLSMDDSGYSNYYFYYQKLGQPRYLVQVPKYHQKSRVATHNAFFGGNRKTPDLVMYLVYSSYPNLL
jgi:hypothetical protein